MLKSKKLELVEEFSGIFKDAITGILVEYQGMTVEELTSLRKTLNEKGSRMRVVKNTLAKRASEGTPFEGLGDYFTKTRALIYNQEDVVSPAKIITKTAETNEKLKVIAGILVSGDQSEVLDQAGIKALGDLPSKEELIAKVLYVLNAPITNFVRTLNEVPSSFVRVVQAVADSKE